MRTAFFCFFLVAAPGVMAQSSTPFAESPDALLAPQPGQSITVLMPQTLTPDAQNWWAQQPGSHGNSPLLAQNRAFAFAMPSPQAPAGRMEPIPTQWPNAKFEGIPTRWANVKVVPLSGARAAASAESGGAALFVQPVRK